MGAFADIYHIEERLKELDSNILRVDFDWRSMRHHIICTDGHEEYTAMSVPLGELDSRVVRRMQEIDPRRGYNPFREIDEANALKERRQDAEISDISRGMADVLYKPLMNHALYGG